MPTMRLSQLGWYVFQIATVIGVVWLTMGPINEHEMWLAGQLNRPADPTPLSVAFAMGVATAIGLTVVLNLIFRAARGRLAKRR